MAHLRRYKPLWAIGVIALLLCCRRSPPPVTQPAPARAPRELPTTDGEIAVGNLASEIAGQERAMQRTPHPAHTGALVGLYLTSAQYLGHLADYDRASALAEGLVREQPQDGKSYELRAQTRASLHRFAEALDDLGRARERGVRPEALEGLLASILQGQGHQDEALPLVLRRAQKEPDILTIGAEAALRGDRGELALAEERFAEAKRRYRDVSPFPVSWLLFQQGMMWQNAGQPSRARDLFADAHARLPAYAAVTSHLAAALAATGERQQAIALLRPLLRESDDPEYAGQLAVLLKEAGQAAEADPLRERARAGYEALLARHPAAFAAHAARFFLGAGDARRALALAQQNRVLSPTPPARELALEAAIAALPPVGACDAAAQELRAPRVTPLLHVLMARAFQGCGRDAEARTQMAAAAAAAAAVQ